MVALIASVLDGDRAQAVARVRELRGAGVQPEAIVTEGIEAAMVRLDTKCTVERFNLLEIMLAGRAVGAVIKELYPDGMPPGAGKHAFVIATLEGDVHKLGELIDLFAARRGFILSAGCEIPPESRPENILAMVAATR